MKLLGIDYGKAKIGLAISGGSLAAPLQVLRLSSEQEVILKIKKIIAEENISELVVGVSENESADLAREFAKKLEDQTNLVVNLFDETLSTRDANAFAIEAGIGREKRRRMEDAYAATLILQSYLDNLDSE